MDEAVAGIGEAHRAGISSRQKAQRFSNRMLAIMAAVAIGALMVVVLGVWVALAWQRSEIASLQQEKADLRGEIAAMKEVSQSMRAQGLKIEFGDCKEQRANAHLRRCSARDAALGDRPGAVLCVERPLRSVGGGDFFDPPCGCAKPRRMKAVVGVAGLAIRNILYYFVFLTAWAPI